MMIMIMTITIAIKICFKLLFESPVDLPVVAMSTDVSLLWLDTDDLDGLIDEGITIKVDCVDDNEEDAMKRVEDEAKIISNTKPFFN